MVFIYDVGGGNVTVQNNYFYNFPDEVISIVGNGTVNNVNMEYNLIVNGAMESGAHLNYLEWSSPNSTNSATIEYNTTYQQAQVSSGEGFQFYDNDSGGTTTSSTVAYNTMIAAPTISMSYLLHGSSGSQYPTATTGTNSVYDNYFDIGTASNQGAYGVFYPGSFNGWTVSNNVDMLTGNIINANNTETSAPAIPVIASFSPDSGPAGDNLTDANVLTLTGTAVAASTVNLYDGTTLLGTATANSSGAWSFATATLANGIHDFTATDTVAGATSAASTVVAVRVDTAAPAAPVITGDAIVNTNEIALTGTAVDPDIAGASDLVSIYEGTTLLGTTTTNASGAWSYTTGALSAGAYAFTATVTDAAGKTSAASQVVDPVIVLAAPLDHPAAPLITPAAPVIASFSPDSGPAGDNITDANVLTLTGTAVAASTVNLYDGTTLLGTATANSSGAWSFATATLANGILISPRPTRWQARPAPHPPLSPCTSTPRPRLRRSSPVTPSSTPMRSH